MLKTRLFWGFILLTTLFGVGFASAQTNNEESITKFVSHIIVNKDNSVDINEVIDYNTGSLERHGIYRDIIPFSSQRRKMEIKNVSVFEKGTPVQFITEKSGSNFRIKIGDPDMTFFGPKTYTINYLATNAVGQLKDLDEIYWNATGNDWNIPIYQTEVHVYLPEQRTLFQSACYSGVTGSKDQCKNPENIWKTGLDFINAGILFPGEGMTVAVGFQKGIVTPYKETFLNSQYLPEVIGTLLPLMTLILSLWYWHKKGRDPKGTGVIVPQYDVPDGLTPMEVVGIVSEKVDAQHISAEIIYLATQGYIKIVELEEKFAGLIKMKDYEIFKIREYDGINGFDKNLLFYLFNTPTTPTFSSFFKNETPLVVSGDSNTVKLSGLKFTFYKYVSSVITLVLNSLLAKGYYKNLGKMKNPGARWVAILFLGIWGSLIIGIGLGSVLFGGKTGPLSLGIFLSVVIYAIVSSLSPAKTEKGVAVKEYLLGLKDYLRIAEKDRLEFHNAPEKRPEVFEKLLPFAMVLGVADIWAKEFEGIYTTPPSWYVGASGHAFSAIAFSNSISHFSAFANSSLSSAPGGGGSGGGGSSGGGGGGGGGGGW
jgi:uncharacterized membrane protein YgcG